MASLTLPYNFDYVPKAAWPTIAGTSQVNYQLNKQLTREAFLERLATVIYELWVIEHQAAVAIEVDAFDPGTIELVTKRDIRRLDHTIALNAASAGELTEAMKLADTWKERWIEHSKPRKLHAKFRREAEAIRARLGTNQ